MKVTLFLSASKISYEISEIAIREIPTQRGKKHYGGITVG